MVRQKFGILRHTKRWRDATITVDSEVGAFELHSATAATSQLVAWRNGPAPACSLWATK
jgi:hypothetical protein